MLVDFVRCTHARTNTHAHTQKNTIPLSAKVVFKFWLVPLQIERLRKASKSITGASQEHHMFRFQ